MAGKILKISANDINGNNVDDRKVVLFSAFEHTKYMNNYAVFTFEGEYNKKKLYYGSIHMKKDSLVFFSVKDSVKIYIEEFLNEYENNNVLNYKILNLDSIDKIELVSYNEMDYDKLELLDNKSIYREMQTTEVVKEKKPIFLYFLLVLLILFGIGITLLYFYPDMFTVKYKELICTNSLYDNKMELNYEITKDIKFNKRDMVDSIDVVKIYTFLDSDSYYEFKDSNKNIDYFNNGEGYKYIDEGLQLRVFYQDRSVIDDYEEMFIYLKREGFRCVESEYER